MKKFATTFFVLTLLVSVQPLAAADRAAAVPPGLRFVAIAPCRILDTAATPAEKKIEESLRQVDLDTSRCSSVLPPYALHYSLQVTTYSQKAPETLAAGTIPARQATTLAASLNRKFNFDIPSGSHIAVDVDGYYVAPGTPLFPFDPRSTGVGGASTTAAASEPSSQPLTSQQSFLQPRAQSVIDDTPTSGDIYLNAPSPFPSTGVRLDATHTAAAPHVAVRLGDAAGASSFSIFNSNATPSDATTILKAMSNGHVVLSAGSYLDGKTSYMQGPAVPGNVVHDVTIVNPRDSAGAATNRVVFFNARSEDEMDSPATTKFQAFTRGYYHQNNINFDSQIFYHWSGVAQYYYRALSTYDPGGAGKETFWVKAATNTDSVTNTRADMYVSGNVGIGTPTPDVKLQVEDLNNNTDMVVSAGDYPGSPNSSTLTLMRKDGSHNQLAKYGFKLDATDGNKFKLLYGGTGAFAATPALVVDTTGQVTIGGPVSGVLPSDKLVVNGDINVSGNINAKYRDVAEWVSVAEEMPAGTVVVVSGTTTDTVGPSQRAYDTRVAGVVSARPGLTLGEASSTKAKIATTGRVKVRVDASKGAIHLGDLLVTSDHPGMAMKSEPLDIGGAKLHRPGTLIGKALEPLAGGEGEILVLLSLQ